MFENAIPSQWRAILAHVQEVFPSAVLAGGALRDLATGKPVKDLDIFIYIDTSTAAERYPQDGFFDNKPGSFDHLRNIVGNSLPWLVATETFDPEYCTAFQKEVIGAIETGIDGFDLPVQLIFQNTPVVPERFDFGICQVLFDGQKVTMSNAFRRDISVREFTLTRGDRAEEIERSYKRWERLREKYDGWKLNDPNGHFRPRAV